MAGSIAHLFAATSFLQSKQTMIGEEYFGEFLLGTIYPDCGYWPGKNSNFSDFVHYVGSSSFPKLIYDRAKTQEWKAFALGWLLHLYMDNEAHPFINKLAASHIRSNKSEVYYEDDKALHAKIENGLDVAISKHFNKTTDISLPKFSENPLSEAFLLNYALVVSDKEITHNCKNIPKYLLRLNSLQNHLSSGDKLSRFIHAILHSFRGKNIKLLQAILYPVIPNEVVLDRFLKLIDSILHKWQVNNQPIWLEENYNLDTGKVAHKSDYQLADEAFKKVQTMMDPSRVNKAFPKSAKNILMNWKNIYTNFNK